MDTGQTVTPDMLFRVGSVTTMFTTAALVSLAEEGQLRLADPIGRYTPGITGKLTRVTARQLMSLCGRHPQEAPAFGAHDATALAATVKKLARRRRLPGAWPHHVPLESRSDAGGLSAGTGREETVRRRIAERLFKPLGMTRSTFRPTVAMTWPFAQGHNSTGAEPPTIVRFFADKRRLLGSRAFKRPTRAS